jgi:hypothetical protein
MNTGETKHDRSGELLAALATLEKASAFSFVAGQPKYWRGPQVQIALDPLRSVDPRVRKLRHLITMFRGELGHGATGEWDCLLRASKETSASERRILLNVRGQAFLDDLPIGTEYRFRLVKAAREPRRSPTQETLPQDSAAPRRVAAAAAIITALPIVTTPPQDVGVVWKNGGARCTLRESLGVWFGRERGMMQFGMAAYAQRGVPHGVPLEVGDTLGPIAGSEPRQGPARWELPLPKSDQKLVVEVTAGEGATPAKPLWELRWQLPDDPEFRGTLTVQRGTNRTGRPIEDRSCPITLVANGRYALTFSFGRTELALELVLGEPLGGEDQRGEQNR